jgi:uncharacterized membrane protein
MSQIEGGQEYTAPVIGLFGAEALMAKRAALQQRLGRASIQLNEASQEYHACISEMIEVNMALREQGVDTNALANELQRDVPAGAAVEGYGLH